LEINRRRTNRGPADEGATSNEAEDAGDVEPLSDPTPERGAAPMRLDSSALRPILWPLSLPGDEEILAILRQETAPPDVLRDMTARFIRGLAPVELGTIQGGADASDWLLRALITRYRLVAATATRPAYEEAIDQDGVAQLVHVSTDLIRTEDLPDAAERTKPQLIKAFVDFGRAKPAPAPTFDLPVPKPGQPVRPTADDLKATLPGRKRHVRRQRVLFALLVLFAIGAGAFHANAYLTAHPKATPPLPGFPEGTVGTRDVKTGALAVRLEDPSQRDALLKVLEHEAHEKGMVVKELAPGVFMLLPPAAKDLPTPATTSGGDDKK
jgi:hypothetical protein